MHGAAPQTSAPATPEEDRTDATRYRRLFDVHGFSPTQKQVIAWVPRGAKVLEVGCSSGYVGRTLIEEKHCDVTGVEIDAAAAQEARANGLRVIEGSLADAAFRDSLTQKFDVVIAADVLEHLPEPAVVLEHFKRWLAPNGIVIIAVPNVATWSIRSQLFFRGDFEYQEEGILDRTHLHFFTWETLHKLVRAQRWQVLETMIDGFHLPGVDYLPIWWPDSVAEKLEPLAQRGTGLARGLVASVYSGLKNAIAIRDVAQRAVLRRFPNLCAPHVALLMRPPSGA